MIWSNDADLISSVVVEEWPAFTDHRTIVAHSTYRLGRQEETHEEVHLLEVGRRMKKIDFNKADWGQVKLELGKLDWSSMEQLEPASALSNFFEIILPVLESTVPVRKEKSKKKNRPQMDRRRRLLWKRLDKVKNRIKSAGSINQLMKLLQDKSELERELKEDYEAVNKMAEDEAVLRIKDNPKAFFSFSKSRQNTRSRIGPFLDTSTGRPNPSPDFAANELSRQYSSVFIEPRQEWLVPDVKDFFSENSDEYLSDINFSEDDIVLS